MKRINTLVQLAPMVLIIHLLFAGCYNYYKVMQSPVANTTASSSTIDSLKAQNRFFILRTGGSAYAMKGVSITADRKKLTCTLDTLQQHHSLHLHNGLNGKMRYNKRPEYDSDTYQTNKKEMDDVLNEVHFFVSEDQPTEYGQFTLDLQKINKMEIIQFDKKRTTKSYVIGVVGVSLGALALVAIIVAAAKSSCPFVSAYDGQEFSLQGEIYGGAIYPQLARHDYMPLRMQPLPDGSLQLKISNELKERQFTDLADLWVITHTSNSQILADAAGNLYSISDPQAPAHASLNGRANVTASLQQPGDQALLYMNDTTADATNEVTLKFNRPAAKQKAKLVLSLKNSYFLDLLYGEMAKGLGSYYNTYVSQHSKKPAAELLKWVKEQHIPLQVSVKTNNGWSIIADLPTIGPLATRDIVVPVELPESPEPFVEIRLSSGFMFWEIDYAALDFTEDNSFSVEKIRPCKATDESGKDVLAELSTEDGLYLAQPEIGNTATMKYRAAPLLDRTKTRSYILHSKGYYEHIRAFSNKPDIGFLSQFNLPGAFPRYGMHLYKKLAAENLLSVAQSN